MLAKCSTAGQQPKHDSEYPEDKEYLSLDWTQLAFCCGFLSINF